jgi:phenylalanyl-tRNA synthetase beta chain
LKQKLLDLGYSETVTYSFVAAEENQRFSGIEPVRLKNPISAETSAMRTSLVPGLLSSFRYNYFRARRNVRIYEAGRLYPTDAEHPLREMPFLGMLASGDAQQKTVHAGQRQLNFFDLKGDLEILLDALRIPVHEVQWRDRQGSHQIPDYYHPRVSAEFLLGKESLGVIGQVHPSICESYKIRQDVFLAEIPLVSWYCFQAAPLHVKEPPKFPAVQRDISLVLDKGIPYVQVTSAILQIAPWQGVQVQSCTAFDQVPPEKLAPGKKGLGISIFYQARDRTLVEEEVNNYHEEILKCLEKELGAQLRT